MAVQTQIQVRRGTASSWTSTNPTLAAGEWGLETDTGKYKVGDGSSVWTGLGYASILPSTVTTKGDLLAATGSGAVSRLAVGSNGYTLVADSSTSTGLNWQQAKTQNAIYNSSFDIYQRSATPSTGITVTGASTYTFDRWQSRTAGAGGSVTTSQQTAGNLSVTPNQAIRYCARFQRVAGNTDTNSLGLYQTLETADSVQFAGKAITLSFYARKGANYSSSGDVLTAKVGSGTGTDQNWSAFTGGATVVENTGLTLTTSWQRFSITGTVATNATELFLEFKYSPTGTAGANDYFEITGVQFEAGSVATAYTRQSGTLQGELAACSRYYYRVDSANASDTRMNTVTMIANSTTVAYGAYIFPVRMRTSPTFGSSTASGWSLGRIAAACTAMAQERASQYSSMIKATVASGLTAGQGDWLEAGNNNTAWIEFSAEL